MKSILTASLFSIIPFLFFGSYNSHAVIVSENIYNNAYGMILEGEGLLQEGDLVVRLNQDPSSRFIKYFNRQDKSYSHSGIVFFENGYPYVYHIVNGEENPGQKLRKDTLTRYCNPQKNLAYGIYRYNMNDIEIRKLKNIVFEWYRKGVQFDSSFNLKTNDRMYCSEMIKKGLEGATCKRIIIETTKPTAAEVSALAFHMHLSPSVASGLQLIAIDNLYINDNCKLVRRFNFFE